MRSGSLLSHSRDLPVFNIALNSINRLFVSPSRRRLLIEAISRWLHLEKGENSCTYISRYFTRGTMDSDGVLG